MSRKYPLPQEMKYAVRLFLLFAWVAVVGRAQDSQSKAEFRLGERLFHDSRFAQNTTTAPVSCATCHLAAGSGRFPARDAVPARGDGQRETPRHTQSLTGALEPGGWGLLHWDGEFATIEDLVKGTFTGRNFGWLPGEQAEAVRHFATVVRGDPAFQELLPGVDPAAATDGQLLDAGASAVGAYLQTLRFSRDETGAHNGSSYDAFLALNRLPRTPAPGETPIRYARRLHEAVAALKVPRYIDDPARRPGQTFRFGEQELKGMRIFFRGALGYGQNSSAGNCAECHPPPHFTDFAFHNTGAAQDGYDEVHGAGAFARLYLPTLAEREKSPAHWLPPSEQLPGAKGAMRSPVLPGRPELADLGLWNVYANPDMPGPQPVIERKLNPEGHLSPDEVLALCIARFKTPALRGLGQSAPYLHNGRLQTIEEVLELYRRMSDLAREGKMRNAPKEYHSMRLQPEDIAPLAAFLRTLNEVNQDK